MWIDVLFTSRQYSAGRVGSQVSMRGCSFAIDKTFAGPLARFGHALALISHLSVRQRNGVGRRTFQGSSCKRKARTTSPATGVSTKRPSRRLDSGSTHTDPICGETLI